MKKTLSLFAGSLVLILFLTGCQKDERFDKKLQGTWNISKLQNTKIFNDGTVEVLADTEDAGSFTFYLDDSGLEVFDFQYTYNGITKQGKLVYYKTDDHAKRLVVYGGSCISCDIAYTIEKDSRNKIEMSTYTLQQQGLETDYVFKLKFFLEKE